LLLADIPLLLHNRLDKPKSYSQKSVTDKLKTHMENTPWTIIFFGKQYIIQFVPGLLVDELKGMFPFFPNYVGFTIPINIDTENNVSKAMS